MLAPLRTEVERAYPRVLSGGGDGTFAQIVTGLRDATAGNPQFKLPEVRCSSQASVLEDPECKTERACILSIHQSKNAERKRNDRNYSTKRQAIGRCYS